MTKITFIDVQGTEKTVNASDGRSLMETAVANSIAGVDADCGGACACATCHVYVDPTWVDRIGAASGMEVDLLEFANEPNERSRLSCQIKVTADMDGLVVQVAAAA
ncbi:2Fe-2S ferredoxin [Rhizobium leguminosarum bv. trifolii]|uniref:2Fe-2S ferredoxin n=1 Tax=Rhizobium leguminosarum bv. trifolii TaxID=386 RepID=A0A3E1BIS6_RHILT|nr:2Fe-2S iron-sulfur cluster-binding protein [Rhizobium leguminosarum]RFB91360.1 2Fe-2S ferredoxin [Rhizobium leguminosarum bv. trifolii]RFB92985.1 2Fe-2S ferredoxin [Rhizobium leguminosarum bv. trifolii]